MGVAHDIETAFIMLPSFPVSSSLCAYVHINTLIPCFSMNTSTENGDSGLGIG